MLPVGLSINIKVDREERPDLDHIYQTALSVLGQQGGWPLTMFLTPDSEPFWGGTYFPPEPRYGMPAFKEVLSKIAEAYSSKNDLIHQNTNSIKIELEKIFSPEATNPIGKDGFAIITEKIMEFLDHRNGGLSGAPKFPHFPLLGLLLNVWKTRKNKKTDITEYYNLIYQYKIDCLTAGIEYKKDYYEDGDIKPKESIFFILISHTMVN